MVKPHLSATIEGSPSGPTALRARKLGWVDRERLEGCAGEQQRRGRTGRCGAGDRYVKHRLAPCDRMARPLRGGCASPRRARAAEPPAAYTRAGRRAERHAASNDCALKVPPISRLPPTRRASAADL